MKKLFSRILASVLVVIMAAMVLAGCGGKSDSGSGSSSGDTSGGGESSGSASAGGESSSGSAGSGETVMLKWIQIGSIPQNNDAVIAAMNE